MYINNNKNIKNINLYVNGNPFTYKRTNTWLTSVKIALATVSITSLRVYLFL